MYRLTLAFLEMYARYDGGAALKTKFLSGEYSGIGAFERTGRKITWSYSSRSSSVSWKMSLVSIPTCRGRWFPNQNRSTTSTLYPRSSSLGMRVDPTYPAPPAMRSFMVSSVYPGLGLGAYLRISDSGEASHSAKVCAFLSFSESWISEIGSGQSMPISQSFPSMPDSPLPL